MERLPGLAGVVGVPTLLGVVAATGLLAAIAARARTSIAPIPRPSGGCGFGAGR